MSADCIFCKIVQKEAPKSKVYEDDQIMAFMDLRPVNEGHTLIIPKKHYVDIYDTPLEVVAEIYKVTKKIAAAVKAAVGADGISIVQQNGSAAGQDIFHIHVHVIPRFEGQRIHRFGELTVASREALDRMAEKVRKQL